MSSVVFGSRDVFRPRSATPTASELRCSAAKALVFVKYCARGSSLELSLAVLPFRIKSGPWSEKSVGGPYGV
jgi:hypothetical protein